MDIEQLRLFCLSLPGVTEDIKWENDLCFCIGEKMFCVTGADATPFTASMKVKPKEYEELASREGIAPAPYLARYKWILVKDINAFSNEEWKHYVKQSYELVKEKLPKRVLNAIGLVDKN